jgi:hypothetical protein
MIAMNDRLEFAAFLRRVAAHDFGTIEWNRFVVRHYHDALLEDIRRKLVKLSNDREGGKEWSDSELAALQQWSRDLGSDPDASPSPQESNPGEQKDWRRTVGMFRGDPIMKEIIDESLRAREVEREQERRIQP